MSSTLQQLKIIDVRLHEHDGDSDAAVREQIICGLSNPQNSKSLPTVLLYNEHGLRLYDRITTEVPEYYLFSAEEGIFKLCADDIVRVMLGRDTDLLDQSKPAILELGAGALRKTSSILLAVSRLVHAQDRPEAQLAVGDGSFTYYALDLEVRELERTLTKLMSEYGDQLKGTVDVKGMWGTYDGGLKFVKGGGLESLGAEDGGDAIIHHFVPNARRDPSPQSSESNSPSSFSCSTDETSMSPSSIPDMDELDSSRPLHLLFLGSSLGNFEYKSSIAFLRGLPLRPGSKDTLLLGMDHDNEKSKIEIAYNDPQGVTREFIMNGLHAAGLILGGKSLFNLEKWEYVNRYNGEQRRHEAYYKSTCHQELRIPHLDAPVSIAEGELVNIEISQKYSDKDAYSIFAEADLRPIMRWMDSEKQYSLWLLERPAFTFPLLKSPNPYGVPSLEDFRTLWKVWDTVTLGMIPREMLHTKPIDLRHICLFYLGHIPTFLDIHLSRLLSEPHTEPEYFKVIFERGIDPDVDDPSKCHPHSEVPQEEEWPTLESILDFRDRVRIRLMKLYDELVSGKRKMTRKIGRVLFMTLEHEGYHTETLLYMIIRKAGMPCGTLPPPGFSPPRWELLAKQWDDTLLPEEKRIVLGPADVAIGHDDCEALDLDEKMFEVDGVEFGWDNEHPKLEVHVNQFRIDWRPVSNGEFYEFYERVGKEVIQFPESWIENDGRIQVRTVYGPIPLEYARHWPVMTSYDNLSKYANVQGGRLPTEAELRLFFDMFESGYEGGANVGFRNWHPIPPTTGGLKDGGKGKGHNGGVWEWTSTILDYREGYVKSTLYPGYSSDFFDGEHHVVIGGSFATIPRMFGRRSLRNWFQHNYPYAWIGARIAYDI